MAINCVNLTNDVFMVCLSHALSTEKEEVMGLLIGEIDEQRVSHISAVIMLLRSDKRKDRVEISPEQLSDASSQAEQLALNLGKPMRILGWYHSHPHITVWPSHVDVETQATYQLMDQGFIGLIFSVFNEDKSTNICRYQVTCFQSVSQTTEGGPISYHHNEIPLRVMKSPSISDPCLASLLELSKILGQEEDDAYNTARAKCNMDFISVLHNSAVYTKSMCHITEVYTVPLLQTLQERLESNQAVIAKLSAEKDFLMGKLKNLR